MDYKIIICLLIVASIFSCKKNEVPENGTSQELVFHSLTAGSDTIAAGTSTSITANAQGYMLTYYWSATAGSLLGSGAELTFVTTPCLIGAFLISCTVKDGKNESQTKTIEIVVQ